MNRYIPIIAFAIAMYIPTYSYAEQDSSACGPHGDIAKHLGDEFHETSHAVALTNSGALIEVFTTEDGATWTLVVTRPDGLSCPVAAGTDWQNMAAAPTSAPAPAPQKYPGVGQNARLNPHKQFDIEYIPTY